MRLEVHQLTAGYGGFTALSEVSLKVAAGEIVGLAGPNKSGKSTLFHCIAGVGPAYAGFIHLDGRPLLPERSQGSADRGVALCPEGPGVFMGLSVRENLGLREGRLTSGQEAEISEHFPEIVPLLGRRAGLLSGGEARLVSIAMRMVGAPRVLLLDEPSVGLAPAAIRRVYAALRSAALHFGTAVIVAEEALPWLRGRVDRAYVFDRGVVVAHGSIEALASDPSVACAFIGEASLEQHHG